MTRKSVYQFMPKVLVIVTILQGMPLWELGNACKWEFHPEKLQKILNILSGPSEALAADPADYAAWQTENLEIPDFDIVPDCTYPGNHFAGRGLWRARGESSRV